MMNNTALNIQIKDNFFTKKEYDILYNNLDKIYFLPNINKAGNYAASHPFIPNKQNKWLFDKIKKQFFPNEDLEIVICRFDVRHNKEKVFSHLDNKNTNYNCIVYLKGEEITYNGTGFYYENNLNTYIGFVKNRALFFNGADIVHSDLQALGPSSARYTLNIFYKSKTK